MSNNEKTLKEALEILESGKELSVAEAQILERIKLARERPNIDPKGKVRLSSIISCLEDQPEFNSGGLSEAESLEIAMALLSVIRDGHMGYVQAKGFSIDPVQLSSKLEKHEVIDSTLASYMLLSSALEDLIEFFIEGFPPALLMKAAAKLQKLSLLSSELGDRFNDLHRASQILTGWKHRHEDMLEAKNSIHSAYRTSWPLEPLTLALYQNFFLKEEKITSRHLRRACEETHIPGIKLEPRGLSIIYLDKADNKVEKVFKSNDDINNFLRHWRNSHSEGHLRVFENKKTVFESKHCQVSDIIPLYFTPKNFPPETRDKKK
jgi:hypothetical protein